MGVTVLKREKTSCDCGLSARALALQVLRERLNNHKDVDYANYFPAIPNLMTPNSTFGPPPKPVSRRS